MKNQSKGNQKSDVGSTSKNFLNGKVPPRRLFDILFGTSQGDRTKSDSLANAKELTFEEKRKIMKFK
jgi:hypothetical protein